MRPEIRAAWRLERIGLTHVFDDEDGEADWVAYGLPTVGSRVRGGWFPTCEFAEPIGTVRDRLAGSGREWAGAVCRGRCRVHRALSSR